MKTSIDNSPGSIPRAGGVSNGAIRTFLAEDSPLLMKWLAVTLSQHHRVFIVGAAPDGRKAVHYASTLQPDLVLMDLHMPGLDGAEATRILKQRPNPPVIFVVTSDDTPEARARSMAAGADAFLVKAANLAPRLLSAIQECFPDDLEQDLAEPNRLRESLTTVE
jgi:DNA-binding NarL/FixJ family response regulator